MTQLEIFDVLPTPAGGRPAPRHELLAAAWLAAYESEHTRRAYRRDLDRWFAWCSSPDVNVDPLEARRVHVDAWVRSGAGYPGGGSASSVARRLSAVSAWYAYLVGEEVTDRNPLAHVRRPPVDPDDSPTRGLTRDEARVFLNVLREAPLRDRALGRLLLLDGLRSAAVRGARADGLSWDRGHRVLEVPMKGGKTKRVPLAPGTIDAVDAYLAGRTTGPLLQTRNGAPMSASQVFRTVRHLAARAGIVDPDQVTPHSLRHAFATLSLDAGAALRDVQDAMGHADPRTTRRYDRARDQLDRHPTYTLGPYLS